MKTLSVAPLSGQCSKAKRILPILLLGTSVFSSTSVFSQCTNAVVNWDNLDYLSRNVGDYATYVTTAMERTQRFAIGPNAVTISALSNVTFSGENINHTGEAGSYGTGADAQYTTTNATATITISFDAQATNVRFSIYDLDASQRVNVSAVNSLSLAQFVTLSSASGTSPITYTLNPGLNPRANTPTTSHGLTSNLGTVNVDIAGPVSVITLSFSNATGDVYLSDITACVTQSFTTNYHQLVSPQPFVGQPEYFIVTPDNNSAYMLDPATGRAKLIFTETGATYINSFAYDAVNRLLYYVTDGTATPSSNRQLKKYDFNTELTSVVLSNINTATGLTIPTFNLGVESAAAAFYGGCLYFGVEGGKQNGGSNTTRETIVWRIAFDGSQNPISATQVMGLPSYTNGTNTSKHDWGDFYVKDGVVFDFNTARTQIATGPPPVYSYPNSSFIQYNMTSGNLVNIPNPNTANPYIGQAGESWSGTLYSIRNVVEQINNAGVTSNSQTIVVTSGPAWVGNAGDASEPFKPKSDFGDAPASYDPNPMSPATHERDINLRIGNNYVHEWTKTASTLANTDPDEDGLGGAPPLLNYNSAVNYSVTLAVYNNSGSNATLFGWLDYNFNGVFDASEAVSVVVGSSAALQMIPVSWNNIFVGNATNTQTYVRFRLSSAANLMTASNATGWFNDGEVEDYRVLRGADLLANNSVNFTASKGAKATVDLKWKVQGFENIIGYEILRSSNGTDWNVLQIIRDENRSVIHQLSSVDVSPLAGNSFYKIKVNLNDGSSFYTAVRSLHLTQSGAPISVYPNPVKTRATLEFTVNEAGAASVELINPSGHSVYRTTATVVKGKNRLQLNDLVKLKQGVYTVKIHLKSQVLVSEIVISK